MNALDAANIIYPSTSTIEMNCQQNTIQTCGGTNNQIKSCPRKNGKYINTIDSRRDGENDLHPTEIY